MSSSAKSPQKMTFGSHGPIYPYHAKSYFYASSHGFFQEKKSKILALICFDNLKWPWKPSSSLRMPPDLLQLTHPSPFLNSATSFRQGPAD